MGEAGEGGTWAPRVQGHCRDLTAELGAVGRGEWGGGNTQGEAGQPGAAAPGPHLSAHCSFVCSAGLVAEATVGQAL